MKAITVRQPWASLIAAGVKTIETRPRSTSYRGRIAIHAGKTEAPSWDPVWNAFRTRSDDRWVVRPLGAVVASAVLTDCVPIHEQFCDCGPRPVYVGRGLGGLGREVIGLYRSDGLGLHAVNGTAHEHPWASTHCNYRPGYEMTQELKYGDYRCGRWALLLDDIKPTTERCPWCWGDGRAPQRSSRCPVCDGTRRCDPVPARGQQAVPWNWAPA